MTTLPGVAASKPGSTGLPMFGVVADVVKKDGTPVGANEGGMLVLKQPWPSMLRTLWNDDERFFKSYFSDIPGFYFTGDGARRDEDGYYWVVGRIDDVLNVAGHRIGTMEVESALVEHPAVAEAAVVGKAHDIKGQAIAAFVTLRDGYAPVSSLRDELRDFVAEKIGAIARPDDLLFAADLPKTRSGKIMRRLLRDIAEGRATGDTTTLADPNVVTTLTGEWQTATAEFHVPPGASDRDAS
jgi:acetyl-CoA synthetase